MAYTAKRSSSSLLTSYPGKALWTLLALTFNTARLPLILLYYIPPFLRQSPKWTFKQAVLVRLLRAFLYNASVVQMRVPLSLEPGSEKDRFVVLKPRDSEGTYDGVPSCDDAIKPLPIGATWYPAVLTKEAKTDKTKVILHFHGGAYVIGDGRTADAGFAAKTLLAHTAATHVLCPQYRLASNPGGRFPAALQDCITAFEHLRWDLGVNSDDIILSGDSAGANLAMGLLRHIADMRGTRSIQPPRTALIWSPWTTPYELLADPSSMGREKNSVVDYIPTAFGLWGATELNPANARAVGKENKEGAVTLAHPAVNFSGTPFETETSLWISVGECEVLYNDVVKMAEQMKGVRSNNVVLDIQEAAPHNIILVGPRLGFEAEAAAAAKRAGAWLDETFSKIR